MPWHCVDNVSLSKNLIETGCGAEMLYLPPYSPDLNPIEKAWFKFQQYMRSIKVRTTEALDQSRQRSSGLHHSRQCPSMVSPLRIPDTLLTKML